MSTWIGGERESERGGGREREEEEAKAAVEYSVRLQQTRDKALFPPAPDSKSGGATQQPRERTQATCYYGSPRLSPSPAGLSSNSTDTETHMLSMLAPELLNLVGALLRFCSHPVVVQRGAPCQSDQFCHA